jgi:hypothetical protein
VDLSPTRPPRVSRCRSSFTQFQNHRSVAPPKRAALLPPARHAASGKRIREQPQQGQSSAGC